MIIWDEILGQHKIRIKGAVKAHLNKHLGSDRLPNKNVTAAQVETVVTNFIDNALSGTDMHCHIHIWTFPKKTQESIPFHYILWLGAVGTEPIVEPGCSEWWESVDLAI